MSTRFLQCADLDLSSSELRSAIKRSRAQKAQRARHWQQDLHVDRQFSTSENIRLTNTLEMSEMKRLVEDVKRSLFRGPECPVFSSRDGFDSVDCLLDLFELCCDCSWGHQCF